jgi:hypothetical protein
MTAAIHTPSTELSTETVDNSAAWWRALTPEVRGVWLEVVTGWTMKRVMAEAHARASGERPKVAVEASDV